MLPHARQDLCAHIPHRASDRGRLPKPTVPHGVVPTSTTAAGRTGTRHVADRGDTETGGGGG
eukprot:3205362-Rhodomonas_salina.1